MFGSSIHRRGVCIIQKFFSFRSLRYKSFRRMYKFRLKIGDKLCCFVALYRSPSQTQYDFYHFHKTLN